MSKKNDTLQITPAAVSALAKDDLENFFVAATPGGIEEQERQGQTWFQTAGVLPKDFGYTCEKEDFEKLGFVFGEDHDEIFVKGSIPEGWSIKPTNHQMWSKVLDSRGRKRAMIFYKAAFYDRHSHMQLCSRFQQDDVVHDGFGRKIIIDEQNKEIVFTSSEWKENPDEGFDIEAYEKVRKEVKKYWKENKLDEKEWDNG